MAEKPSEHPSKINVPPPPEEIPEEATPPAPTTSDPIEELKVPEPPADIPEPPADIPEDSAPPVLESVGGPEPEEPEPPKEVDEVPATPTTPIPSFEEPKIIEEPPPPAKIIEEPPPPAKIIEEPPPPAKIIEEPPPPAKIIEEPPPPVKIIEDPPPTAKIIEEPTPAKIPDEVVPQSEESPPPSLPESPPPVKAFEFTKTEETLALSPDLKPGDDSKSSAPVKSQQAVVAPPQPKPVEKIEESKVSAVSIPPSTTEGAEFQPHDKDAPWILEKLYRSGGGKSSSRSSMGSNGSNNGGATGAFEGEDWILEKMYRRPTQASDAGPKGTRGPKNVQPTPAAPVSMKASAVISQTLPASNVTVASEGGNLIGDKDSGWILEKMNLSDVKGGSKKGGHGGGAGNRSGPGGCNVPEDVDLNSIDPDRIGTWVLEKLRAPPPACNPAPGVNGTGINGIGVNGIGVNGTQSKTPGSMLSLAGEGGNLIGDKDSGWILEKMNLSDVRGGSKKGGRGGQAANRSGPGGCNVPEDYDLANIDPDRIGTWFLEKLRAPGPGCNPAPGINGTGVNGTGVNGTQSKTTGSTLTLDGEGGNLIGDKDSGWILEKMNLSDSARGGSKKGGHGGGAGKRSGPGGCTVPEDVNLADLDPDRMGTWVLEKLRAPRADCNVASSKTAAGNNNPASELDETNGIVYGNMDEASNLYEKDGDWRLEKMILRPPAKSKHNLGYAGVSTTGVNSKNQNGGCCDDARMKPYCGIVRNCMVMYDVLTSCDTMNCNECDPPDYQPGVGEEGIFSWVQDLIGSMFSEDDAKTDNNNGEKGSGGSEETESEPDPCS